MDQNLVQEQLVVQGTESPLCPNTKQLSIPPNKSPCSKSSDRSTPKKHIYPCRPCNRKFEDLKAFERHQQMEHYECDNCFKFFSYVSFHFHTFFLSNQNLDINNHSMVWDRIVTSYSNFSCMFLNPNNIFEFEF